MAMPNKNQPHKGGQHRKFLRFTGAAMQMGLTIYAGNWLGKWLDEKYSTENYESTVTLIAIFIAMYFVIQQVLKLSKD